MGGKKIGIVFGTRPEIVKLSSIIKYCERKKQDFFTIHTGQHYSENMDKVFFEELGLPQPSYSLEIKSETAFMQGMHTGRMMEAIEKIILQEKPEGIIVQGDTNTVLAASLVTAKIGTVKQLVDFSPALGHVEACLRSHDKSMPEEMNRIISDHISNCLFAPTQQAKENGEKENIPAEKIFVTGNTVVDALEENLKKAEKNSIMEELNLEKKRFALLTLHRQENVDVKERLSAILSGISEFGKKEGIPIIFPMHPRTKKMLDHFKLELPSEIRQIEPLGYFEFLCLEKNAAIALTDSGGVQEEACILGVPCVTLRQNTERPETVQIGANCIAGYGKNGISSCCSKMLQKKTSWKQPFGDGKAGEKIMKIFLKGK